MENIDPSLRDFLPTQTNPQHSISRAPNRFDRNPYTSMPPPSHLPQHFIGDGSPIDNNIAIQRNAFPIVRPRAPEQADRGADAVATGRKRKESDTWDEEDDQENSRELKTSLQAAAA
ncbi:uncharacterized protein RCC_09915 [Ramularia collo-cygni]|uniref:Uncharacterized protein n=1 Tax=Ramularia collo-cygni TaxID=112498 RepID=A0A2D3VQ51_9PEZI|nr:uncharacterized protein RCC_09915 [Ramularia collo-cygni]CZT24198.1 uncharacterized protein RCC_09915 [Ramularia collo-cygni]